MQYTVTQKEPLLSALEKLLPDSSKQTLRKFLKEGRISVNKQTIDRASFAVEPGDIVEFLERKTIREGLLEILFEDSDLVVINKPTGLLSVKTEFEQRLTAHALLKQRHKNKKVYVIHRLDQETSGVMVFALSENAYTGLKEALKNRDVKREYIAIVEGKVLESGSWDTYLYEDAHYKVHVTEPSKKSERAITHYRPIRVKKNYTVLLCTLETGKKNQIRVQATHAGHPIVGDTKYGSSTSFVKRLGLHAKTLTFSHPITNKLMSFSAKLPKEFEKFVPDTVQEK